jgi:hypothetical protein
MGFCIHSGLSNETLRKGVIEPAAAPGERARACDRRPPCAAHPLYTLR